MLAAIREFFERNIATPAGGTPEARALHLATAALLVEVARIDRDLDERERAVVLRAVRDKFGLADEDAEALARLAEDEMRAANDYFQFTSLINRGFDQAQKVRVIELMWQVAYASDGIDAHERHLLRRIADLLHVPHGDYVAAQARARQAADAG
jgi:uncharacterized tellurite resistance protein B-like protein